MASERKETHHGPGRSSFGLIDPAKLFAELQLKKGDTFLDLACGSGEYSIAASETIGAEGLIYAIDLREEGIASLQQQASAKGIRNIQACVGDITNRIPVENGSADVCLMATVLHELVQAKAADGVFREISRVLNTKGSLAILEFKKIDGPPGPPINIRLAPEDVESIASPYGFIRKRVNEVGPHNYLITFDLHVEQAFIK